MMYCILQRQSMSHGNFLTTQCSSDLSARQLQSVCKACKDSVKHISYCCVFTSIYLGSCSQSICRSHACSSPPSRTSVWYQAHEVVLTHEVSFHAAYLSDILSTLAKQSKFARNSSSSNRSLKWPSSLTASACPLKRGSLASSLFLR